MAWRPGETFTDWLVRTLQRRGVEPTFNTTWRSLAEVEPSLGREILAISRRDSNRPALRAMVDALQHSFNTKSSG